jgi:tRNA (guanosine-2'-O-)-methyltransferase
VTPERFARLKAVLDRRQPDLTVLAEDVHKAHNISAVLRSCDAVGVAEIHVVSPGGEFYRHHMVSGGSRKWVQVRPHRSMDTAVHALHARGFQVLAAHFSAAARDYRDVDYTRPTAILVGAERTGVSAHAAALADGHILVPMRGMVSSLNVSVATAVILYEAARQRDVAGLYAHCRFDAETYRAALFEWCYPGVAQICQAQGLPYPDLDESGFILRPDLSQAVRAGRRTARRTSGAAS